LKNLEIINSFGVGVRKHINYSLLTLVFFLTVFGLSFLSTLSSIDSLQTFGNTNYYLFHQLTSVAIGLIFALIIFKIPLTFLKKISFILLLIKRSF
jgi:cell division protein FtsW (lipid II flippase)